MTVSFIIPLFNCLPLTQAMLASLRATLPADLDYEILFVDDGSTDGTRAWLAELAAPCCVVLNEKNLGFAGACNRAAATARGTHLVFLNNDLVLLRGWLEPMLAALVRWPDAGLVGNVQRNFATGAVDHTGIFFNAKGKPAHATQLPLTTRLFGLPAYRTVAALTGACFAILRTTWEQLGGFDDGFINGGEDIDLCLRARAAGLRHFIALRSVVRHHISASAGRKLRDEQNTFRLVQRWHDQIALFSAREWSRQQILAHADQSHVMDYGMILQALAYLLGLRLPPPGVRAGVALALAQERERWSILLDRAAPPPVLHLARTDQI